MTAHYRVRIEESMRQMDVRACFSGATPSRLIAVQGSPGRYVTEATGPGGARLDVGPDRIEIGVPTQEGCVSYGVDLRRATGDAWYGSGRGAEGADLLLSHDDFFWVPEPRGALERATLRFVLPEGMRALVPWQLRDGRHVLDASALDLVSHVAIGRFQIDAVDVPGGSLRFAVLEGPLRLDQEQVRAWLREAASAVATIGGRFPAEGAVVVVVPVEPGPDPVAFGLVRRGGGPSVMLLVRENAELESLLHGDWVAVHELTHLLMPLVKRRDAWLSEGIATYYQEVARARRGLQTPLEAWRAIDDGFERGRAVGTGATLRKESAMMTRTGAFRRVYWSGAAFALELDLRLRRESGGRASLDAAVGALGELSKERAGGWTADELLARMDQATSTTLCTRVGRRYAALRTFPRVDVLWRELGLIRGPDGELVPAETGHGTSLRNEIMSPADPALARAPR